jgi:hypothetical protein
MFWIADIYVEEKWRLKLKREWIESREEGRDFRQPDRACDAEVDELESAIRRNRKVGGVT